MNKEEPSSEQNNQDKPLNWIEKQTIKRTLRRIEKYKKQWEKEDKHTKEELIKTIWNMTDILTIYEDEEQTKETTLKDLENKTKEELTQLLTEILEETKKLI